LIGKKFLTNLFQRRVPQILGVYLGTCWVVVEFMDWLVERHGMSPDLTDVILTALLLMIPTVAILAYHHGQPGRNKWTKVQKIGIPVNLLVTLVLVTFIFSGKSFDYSIGQQEKNGKQISIAVVDFVNETDEKELDGLSGMLITALEQSRRLSVLTRSRLFDVLKQLGKQDVEHIDEQLGIEICKYANVQALAIASIRKLGTHYAIDLKVLDAQKDEYLLTAKEAGEGQESVFEMIDNLAEKTRVGLKEQAEEIQAASQKVAEVTTTNLEAYQHYFKGEELINKFEFGEAEDEFEKAIALDSTFALAYSRLAYAIAWWNTERAKEPLHKALALIDRIPEKERYLVRAQDAQLEEGFKASLSFQTSLQNRGPKFGGHVLQTNL